MPGRRHPDTAWPERAGGAVRRCGCRRSPRRRGAGSGASATPYRYPSAGRPAHRARRASGRHPRSACGGSRGSPSHRAQWSRRLQLPHRLADQVVLLAHEQQRVDLAELGERVTLPFARPVAAVAALDEDAHELGVVDRRLLPVLVDVVELRVHVQDLRHDVGPLLRGDVPVHVEREVRERAEAARVEVAALEVADELLLALLHRGIRRPDRLQLLRAPRRRGPRAAPRAAASATSRASSRRSPRRSRAAASRARRRSRAPSAPRRRSGPSGRGSRTRA